MLLLLRDLAAIESLEQLELLDRLLQLMLLLLRYLAAIESLEQLERLERLLQLMLLLRDLLLLVHDTLKQADVPKVRLCLLEVRSALFSVPLSEV